MSIRFSKKQLLIFSAGIILLGLISVYVYFAVIQPAELKRDQANLDLKTERALQKSQSQKKTSDGGTLTDYMQKQLPSLPLVDQYILDLTKAEEVSGVIIENAAFQDGAAPKETEKGASSAPVPLTLNVEVKYDVYEQFYAFLKEVEDLPRITSVQNIDFKGRDEILSPDTKQNSYSSTLTLVTYYMPTVKDAEKRTSDLELPPLCKDRTNPIEPQVCK
jgi:type IV pilus assembly protein PilO